MDGRGDRDETSMWMVVVIEVKLVSYVDSRIDRACCSQTITWNSKCHPKYRINICCGFPGFFKISITSMSFHRHSGSWINDNFSPILKTWVFQLISSFSSRTLFFPDEEEEDEDAAAAMVAYC